MKKKKNHTFYSVGDVLVNLQDQITFYITDIKGNKVTLEYYNHKYEKYCDLVMKKSNLTYEINNHDKSHYIKHYPVVK